MDPEKIFKYCPKCGHTIDHDVDNHMVCSNCKFSWYLNPMPCVTAVIINDKNEVLLAKRKNEPHAGSWDVLGGFVEPAETFSEALIRELEEEIGITFQEKSLEYLNSTADRYEYSNVNNHTLSNNFIIHTNETNFIPKDDVLEVKFFKLDELPYSEIKFDSIKTILELVIKELSK